MRQIFLLLLCVIPSMVFGAPPPPGFGGSHYLLEQAKRDVKAFQYSDALEKYVQFYKSSPQVGLRILMLMNDWKELCAVYPTAKQKLREIRDEIGEKIRESKQPLELFIDYSCMNQTLKEGSKTVELFKWFDFHKPELAKSLYIMAHTPLVQAREYKLCGTYMDANALFAHSLEMYHDLKAQADRPGTPKEHLESVERTFIDETSVLIALLVINGKHGEADHIAAEAIKELDKLRFSDAFEKAKQGQVPQILE